MTSNLHGKIILITGASRGIGRAVALAASKVSAELIITGAQLVRWRNWMMKLKRLMAKATIVEA